MEDTVIKPELLYQPETCFMCGIDSDHPSWRGEIYFYKGEYQSVCGMYCARMIELEKELMQGLPSE